MITAGKEYGSALYALARENGNPAEILEQLEALEELFRSEPQWYDLLTSPTLGKQERLDLIEKAVYEFIAVSDVTNEAQEHAKETNEKLYREDALKKQISFLQKQLDELHIAITATEDENA